MNKSDVIISKLEEYISGKENPKDYYLKFRKALVNFNEIEKDEDIAFLKETIDSNLCSENGLSFDDFETYTDVVDYFQNKEEVYKRTIQ